MESHTVETTPAVGFGHQELLGDIAITPETRGPVGGLNPYNPHFDKIGKQFLKLMIEHAELLPRHTVLDVGCGTGRLARQLIPFLDEGRYHGFDVHSGYIDYCRKTYTSRNPDFRRCDVRHDEYNPNGTVEPEHFVFPYDDRMFDLVIAIAVFNHFHLGWVVQYVRQIARVLRPRGIFFGTIFLLNGQSITFIKSQNKHPFRFDYRTSESWYEYYDRPLFNVAHPEGSIRRAFIASNLMIKEPIRYGEWCASRAAITGHDVIIAKKGGWGK